MRFRTSYILFLGRLNRIKGPGPSAGSLLQAYQFFPRITSFSQAPTMACSPSLKVRPVVPGAAGFVHFIGYVSGADKGGCLSECLLMVIPSRLEGNVDRGTGGRICGTPVR